MTRADRLTATAILVAAAFVLHGNLGGAGPTRRDERAYADVARTMLETGDWITPRLSGEPFFNKPPLLYWLVAGSELAGGISPSSARRPVAFLALAGVLLVWAWAREIAGPRAGAIAALACIGNALYFTSGRLAMMDAPLAVLVLAATRWLDRGAPGRGLAAAGLAVLLKGPIGLALPLGAVAAERILAGRARELARLFSGPGVVAFLALTAPWFVAMERLHGEAFLRKFFLGETLFALVGEEGRRTFPVWPYLLILPASFVVFLPALFPAARSALGRRDPPVRLLGLLALETVLLFLLSFRKADRYFVPAVPPLAILIGVLLARGEGRGTRVALRAGTALLGLLSLAVPAAVAWGTPEAGWIPAAVSAAPLLLGFALAARAWRAGRLASIPLSLGASVLALEATLVLYLFGALARDPVRRFEEVLAGRGMAGVPLAAETAALAERLAFDLRRSVERVPDLPAAEAWLAGPPPRAALLRAETWNRISRGVRGRAEELGADWIPPRVSWRWLRERGFSGAFRDREERLVLVAVTR
ncbi:MAG TPA: phospholipid carrier-dependent glycosyltransferase [Planctomycetota bacterium]|jgi:4-amino-4-deoxy-L-arabinose transferase-like glycosyltransferase|nr:phospholipid carrier-dependent glycosyltransferase [Planctomycetota bacterium]